MSMEIATGAKSPRLLLSCALLVVAAGCAQCAPDRVGPGVARLTVRNVGAIVSLANADTTCGFASEAVLGSPSVEGEIGSEGSITFTVKDCVIDAAEGLELSKNCEDVTTTARGKVTVSATRKVEGTLTGNPANPIIPAGPDAVTITLQTAVFEDFIVENSASKNTLRMISGSIAATVSPRLAVSSANGLCAVATPHTTFSNIAYGPSKLFLDSPDNAFDVEVDSSSISAQNGTKGDATNALGGTISVWGSEVPAIAGNDEDGLDPDFDAEKFEAGYACTAGLAQPVSFTCDNLKPRLAGGVARLSARTLGTVTSLIDANDSCGFKSAAVAGQPTFTGEVGQDNSTATFTIASACTITLPADTLLSTDCAGVETRGGGTLAVTGTKQVTGFRTGNPQQPIVPTRRDPAAFDLSVTFTDFQVKNSASTSWMKVKSGELAGKVAPRTGLDKTTGVCSISTPVVTFSDLSWTDANVQLVTDGNHFDLAVSASDLDAQNGTKDTVSNTVSGHVTVDGTSYSLAAAGEPLDAAFAQEAFDASYACNPKLIVAPNEATCSFRQAIGTAAARLLVKSFATSVSMLNGNSTCGFATPAVQGAPTDVQGAPGDMGSITWSVTDCTMGPIPADTTISTNCVGSQRKAEGTVTATGTKTVTGLRGTNPPIIPVTRDAATFALSAISLNGFRLYDLPLDATAPTTVSTISANGALVLKPVGGESLANPGVYSISTPVANLETLTIADGTISIESDGNRFDLNLADVSITAFTGSWAGASNEIVATLTVDQQPVSVTMSALDPAFDQAAYDATYACTPDLKEAVPAE